MKYCKLFVDNQVLLLFLFILNLVCNGVWLSQQFGIMPVAFVLQNICCVLTELCSIFVTMFAYPNVKTQQMFCKTTHFINSP